MPIWRSSVAISDPWFKLKCRMLCAYQSEWTKIFFSKSSKSPYNISVSMPNTVSRYNVPEYNPKTSFLCLHHVFFFIIIFIVFHWAYWTSFSRKEGSEADVNIGQLLHSNIAHLYFHVRESMVTKSFPHMILVASSQHETGSMSVFSFFRSLFINLTKYMTFVCMGQVFLSVSLAVAVTVQKFIY